MSASDHCSPAFAPGFLALDKVTSEVGDASGKQGRHFGFFAVSDCCRAANYT